MLGFTSMVIRIQKVRTYHPGSGCCGRFATASPSACRIENKPSQLQHTLRRLSLGGIESAADLNLSCMVALMEILNVPL
jgi:hypothetical protein